MLRNLVSVFRNAQRSCFMPLATESSRFTIPILLSGFLSFTQKHRLIVTSSQPLEKDKDEIFRKICEIFSNHSKTDIVPLLDKIEGDISPNLVVRVLQRFEHSGMQALKFFHWAGKQNGYEHSTEAYNSVIQCIGRVRKFDQIWRLLNEMQIKGLLTQESFLILIRWYARAKLHEEALETFRKMTDYGILSDLEGFNGLLVALCKANRTCLAQHLFDVMLMKERKYKPDLRTYSILIQAWGNEKNSKRTEVLMKEALSNGFIPDINLFVIYLNALCKIGKLEKAAKLLDEMRVRGLKPNAQAHTILIHAYSAKKEIGKALDVFKQLKKDGCAADSAVYNALIGGFCAVGKAKQAYRVLETMEKDSVSPDSRTYNIMISYFRKTGKLRAASRVFLRMVERDCSPDAKTYTMMLKMLTDKRRCAMALNIWEYMCQRGFCPTSENISVLVNGLCKNGKLKRACSLFEEMLEKGIMPPRATFNRIKDVLMTKGREDIVKRFSERMDFLSRSSKQEIEVKYRQLR